MKIKLGNRDIIEITLSNIPEIIFVDTLDKTFCYQFSVAGKESHEYVEVSWIQLNDIPRLRDLRPNGTDGITTVQKDMPGPPVDGVQRSLVASRVEEANKCNIEFTRGNMR